MFTKTLSALAILLSTVCAAVAVTKHEGTAASRAPANKASPQNPRDKADFVIGNMLFVGFHEMGHALTDLFHLPTLGRAEDAADSFATIALLDAGSEFSINVLVQAARGACSCRIAATANRARNSTSPTRTASTSSAPTRSSV